MKLSAHENFSQLEDFYKKKKEKSTEFSFGLDWNYRGVSNNSCLGKDESSNPWTYLGYH